MADDEQAPTTDEAKADQPDRDWQAKCTNCKPLVRKHEKSARDNAEAFRRLDPTPQY